MQGNAAATRGTVAVIFYFLLIFPIFFFQREVKSKVLLREAQSLGGVVVVDDPLKEYEDLFNDRYLLGNTRSPSGVTPPPPCHPA